MKVKSEPYCCLNGYCVEEMELLERILKIFKEIPRKLTCSNSFCKVAASKALISMQQAIPERKLEGEHYGKSRLLKLLKRKNPHGCFQKPAAY